ncbi:MAG: hypothetical protein FJ213_07665 [Ignavibacteria bacterium]|nr:hypothetical protein [Ignavibacteria bacterium]
MSKFFLIILILIISVATIFSQISRLPRDPNQFSGGLGLSWIDGEPYYMFSLSPDIAIGKFGVGLDLNLRINKEGNVRHEDFNTLSDYLSLIKYLRYGYKRDPFYVKVGGLDRAILGQGNIVYYYNNRASFDNKKIGIELDIDFGDFGFESLYGDLSGKGIFGLRGYTRPLHFTPAADIPIIGNLEVGASYATDLNDFSGVTSAMIDPTSRNLKITSDEGSTSIIGLDASLPLLRAKLVDIDLYSNFTKIVNFGSGATAGIGFFFSGLGLFSADLRFERWFNGDQFIPKYFNQFYEIQRFIADSTKGSVSSKVLALKNAKTPGNAYYGELVIDLLNFVQIFGSYSRYDKISNSGTLRLETDLSPKDASFVVRGYYDKFGIFDEKDIFKLDDRSILTAEAGYKPIPYVLVSVIYQWTYTPQRDISDKVIGYSPQKRIEPRISFIFPFGSGEQFGEGR